MARLSRSEEMPSDGHIGLPLHIAQCLPRQGLRRVRVAQAGEHPKRAPRSTEGGIMGAQRTAPAWPTGPGAEQGEIMCHLPPPDGIRGRRGDER